MKYSMKIAKKLFFAPFFLLAFVFSIYQLNPLLASYDFIFSLSFEILISLVIISALILSSASLFVLSATIASNWKISLPVGIIASAVPLIFIPSSLALIFAVAVLVSFLLTSLNLDSTLKSYLTFKPFALLGPSIRHLSTLLILSFCLIYFLSASKAVAQNGFQIPDSLIDTALKMTPLPSEQTQLPNISPDQISKLPADAVEMLKKNPANDLIKKTVKDQVQNFIKPYMSFIPALLAVLLFLTFQSLVSLLNLFIYPLLWIIFLILEKTGFVKFELEQRPVKKLVV